MIKLLGATYYLCSHCWRAVPNSTREHYCPNDGDGTMLLTTCPRRQSAITSPYASYCVRCGQEFKEEG